MAVNADVQAAKDGQQLVRDMTTDTALDLWVARFGTQPAVLSTYQYAAQAFWFAIGRKLVFAGKLRRRIHQELHAFQLTEETAPQGATTKE